MPFADDYGRRLRAWNVHGELDGACVHGLHLHEPAVSGLRSDRLQLHDAVHRPCANRINSGDERLAADRARPLLRDHWSSYSRPASSALSTARVRSRTPNFAKMLDT